MNDPKSGNPDDEGRYNEMRLRIIKDANEGIRNMIAGKEIPQVIDAAKKEFASRPQPERLETFDGTLASETRSRALYAILASWVALLLYLWFRFGNWTFGAAAVICLIPPKMIPAPNCSIVPFSIVTPLWPGSE